MQFTYDVISSSSLRKTGRGSQKDGRTRQSLATSLLVPVSIFHLLTTLPFGILGVVDALKELRSKAKNKKEIESFLAIGYYILMLSFLNNGINCLVYFASSQRFRKHLYQLLKDWKSKFLKCFCKNKESINTKFPNDNNRLKVNQNESRLCRTVSNSSFNSGCSFTTAGGISVYKAGKYLKYQNKTLNNESTKIELEAHLNNSNESLGDFETSAENLEKRNKQIKINRMQEKNVSFSEQNSTLSVITPEAPTHCSIGILNAIQE